MLIIFGFLVIIAGITWANWEYSRTNDKMSNARTTVWVSSIISTVIVVIIISVSYATYLNIRAQYDAVINQYKGAVTMYADYASLDMEKVAFTDFKYQGYQENIAGVITDLRKEIVGYNKVLIMKRVMDRNSVFSWLIIAPDEDMKIINIVE